MRIGIIGAGQISGTLTRRRRALWHQVFVANSRGPETLAGWAKERSPFAHLIRSAVLVRLRPRTVYRAEDESFKIPRAKYVQNASPISLGLSEPLVRYQR